MSELWKRNLRSVEVTRRKFVRKLVKSCSVIFVGIGALIRSLSARKPKRRTFLRAFRVAEYPGPVKALGHIDTHSKWSG